MNHSGKTVLSIVIVSFNTEMLLRNCLDSVLPLLKRDVTEIIVVDNASTDGTVRMLREEYPQVRSILNETNSGFGAANNQGMAVAEGDFILLLNSDTLASPEALLRCIDYLEQEPTVGVVGCRLESSPGELQLSCGRFYSLAHAFFGGVTLNSLLRKLGCRALPAFEHILSPVDHTRTVDVDWVSGAFMMMRKEVFHDTRGFDERIFLYGEEHEWCYRIKKKGWRVRYFPHAFIIHLGKGSGGGLRQMKRTKLILAAEEYFFRKHFGITAALLFRNISFAVALPKALTWLALTFFNRNLKPKALYNLAVLQWYFAGPTL